MGFLRRLLGTEPKATPSGSSERQPVVDLGDRRGEPPANGLGLYSGAAMNIVGESHYREVIAALVGGPRPEAIRLVTWAALVCEPDNPYDASAIRVEISGRRVGYLSRSDAVAFAPVIARLDAAGRVGYGRADIYGGWSRGPMDQGDYGITLYIGAPEKQATLLDRALDGKTSAEIAQSTPPLTRGRQRGPGMVRGRPYFEWHPEVRRLEQAGDEAAAEALLLEICDATEAEARVEGYGVAPAAYDQLAVLYRKRKDAAAELSILERYEAQTKAPGATPEKLAERLAKLRSLRQPS